MALRYVDDFDVWHEGSCHLAISRRRPGCRDPHSDDDHFVEVMGGDMLCRFGGGPFLPICRQFQSIPIKPSGDQLSGLLDEGRRMLEADGHPPVR